MGAMSTRGMAVRPFSAAQIPRRTRAATSGSHVCRSTGSDREACSGQYARRGRQSEVDRRGALASLAAAAVLSVVSPAARAEVQVIALVWCSSLNVAHLLSSIPGFVRLAGPVLRLGHSSVQVACSTAFRFCVLRSLITVCNPLHVTPLRDWYRLRRLLSLMLTS